MNYHLTMPLYDVEHVISLTDHEQQDIATAITNLHSHRFNTPKWFVNVRFTDASNVKVFRGGVETRYNRLVIRTRHGGTRTVDVYNAHCRDIMKEWERVMSSSGSKASPVDERGLRTVWVTPILAAAVDMGFERPKARLTAVAPMLFDTDCETGR